MNEASAKAHMDEMMAEEAGKMMNSIKEFIERRSFVVSEIRVEGVTPIITGHAAVYNQKSEMLWGFRETIRRGAFTKTIKTADVRALWNHDPNFVLGRTKSRTLELGEDSRGLTVKITPPDTGFAKDMLAIIKRGDVDQMSFGFKTIADEWRTEDKEQIRELIEVELFDVSPVTFPAYPQTDVSARSYYEARMKDGLQAGSPITLDLAEMVQSARQKQRQEFLDSRRPILKPGDDGYLAEIIRKAHRA